MTENKPSFIKPVWQAREKAEPYMSDFFAIISVAASVVAMVFLGTLNVLLLYAIWLPQIFYRGQWVIKPSKDILLPAAIIIYSIASAVWSRHPDITLRIGLEFGSLICCSLIIARIIQINAFIKGVTLGMFISLAIVFISAGSIQTESALTGSLGSKNQVGMNSEIGFFCALLCLFIFKEYWKKILIILPAMVFFAGCLFLSKSSTSTLSLAAMIAVSFFAYILTKFSRNFRMVILILTILLGGVIAAIGFSSNLQELGLKAVGKDATLTGRTELWDAGKKIGMQNPIFGVGLGAFWVAGTPEAERIWFNFFIANKTGFHFHNLFINIFVDLGIIGVTLWGLMYISTFLKSFRYLLKNDTSIESMFYVGMSFMYFVRAFVESDTTGPYGTGPLLFFYIVFSVASKTLNKSS
jgi:exopolysaccharide production protein ExoQ